MSEDRQAFLVGWTLGLIMGCVLATVAWALFTPNAQSPAFTQALDTWHELKHMERP